MLFLFAGKCLDKRLPPELCTSSCDRCLIVSGQEFSIKALYGSGQGIGLWLSNYSRVSVNDCVRKSANAAHDHRLTELIGKRDRHTLRRGPIRKNKCVTGREKVGPFCLTNVPIVDPYSVREAECMNEIAVLLFRFVEFARYQ